MGSRRRTGQRAGRGIGERVGRSAEVVLTQIAVGLCLAAAFAWGVAAFAGLESLISAPVGSGTLVRVSWSLVVGLYVGLIGVAASAGALALGWLPVFALGHMAWLLAPPNRRWLSATIYPAPVLAFLAAAWLIPEASVLCEPVPMALGLAFAAIPSLVLAAFHVWVLAPDQTPGDVPTELSQLRAGPDSLLAAPHQQHSA